MSEFKTFSNVRINQKRVKKECAKEKQHDKKHVLLHEDHYNDIPFDHPNNQRKHILQNKNKTYYFLFMDKEQIK